MSPRQAQALPLLCVRSTIDEHCFQAHRFMVDLVPAHTYDCAGTHKEVPERIAIHPLWPSLYLLLFLLFLFITGPYKDDR